MGTRKASIKLPLASALCLVLTGCIPAPYGAYYKPSYPDPSATLSREYCGGQAGPPSTLVFNAPEGVVVSVSAARGAVDKEQGGRHLLIGMSIPPGTRFRFLADGFELSESFDGARRHISGDISVIASLKLGVDTWVDIEQLGPTDTQAVRNFAAANPERPIGTAYLTVPRIKGFAPDVVLMQMPAITLDGASVRPPPIELSSDSQRTNGRVYRTKGYLQALEGRVAKCRTETPQRNCDSIARYETDGLRLDLDGFVLSGRLWVWDVRANTPLNSELKLTVLSLTRWKFSNGDIQFTDRTTGEVRQVRMGPVLVSWNLPVPFTTPIKAIDVGENPGTRILINSSLGRQDASRYVIRLPAVQINGREYTLKPIELELRSIDGGLEPFNC